MRWHSLIVGILSAWKTDESCGLNTVKYQNNNQSEQTSRFIVVVATLEGTSGHTRTAVILNQRNTHCTFKYQMLKSILSVGEGGGGMGGQAP